MLVPWKRKKGHCRLHLPTHRLNLSGAAILVLRASTFLKLAAAAWPGRSFGGIKESFLMTLLERVKLFARQFESGNITATEFANNLRDFFAGDSKLNTAVAGEIAAVIPSETKHLVIEHIHEALSPSYLRQAFALGGRLRTKEDEQNAALKETAREQTWAEALKPHLTN
jgi:hypothetical protein